MSAFYDLAFMLGAFQAEADSGDMQDFAFQECAFQADAFQADVCTDIPPVEETPRVRRGGGRKFYEIKGRRYFLTEEELARLIPKILEEIKRRDIKVDDPVKPKNISRRSWAELKKTLQVLEATMLVETQPMLRKLEQEVIEEDDDEEVLMALY